MRASISADSGRGPGYGIIEFFEADAPAEPMFTMQRASDAKYLGPGGWQESETPLAPDAWDNDGGSLRLAVGPAVVDEVDNLSAYRITLSGRGSCTLAVKNIVYSHITGGQGMGGTSAEPTPPPQPEPVPEPAPEPEAAPQEPAEPPLVLGPVEDPLAGASIDMPLDEKKPKGKGLVVLLLVLAALAAAAVWWFVLRAPEKAPLPVPPAAAEQTPGNEKQPPAAAPQPGSQGAQSQPTPLAAAREQLRGQALPDVSLGMAKPLRKADAKPEESDAAFLLLEDAAQKGNADAMFLVAQFYDPASTLPRGSIPVDIAQAKRWYEEALQKGQTQAKAALDALKEHVRALEAKGDPEARSLLQNWQ